MQDQSADKLYVVMALFQCTPGRLSHCGKGFRHHIVQAFSVGQPRSEFLGHTVEFAVGHLLKFDLQLVDIVDERSELL